MIDTSPVNLLPPRKEVIPGSIVKAICAVMTTVDAVKKSQKNLHGNWFYASADDIYAAVTRKMGDVGLAIISLEGDVEIVDSKDKEGKPTRWLKVTHFFILATESDTWEHPGAKRTVMTQVSGPQAHQAAQSYCEKAFLRSLFKLPTGDMDLDAMPEDFEYTSVFTKRDIPPPPPPETGQRTAPEEINEEMVDWNE